jgi:1,4-dihydroxy-2-naphthoyl-CoA hydrolase
MPVIWKHPNYANVHHLTAIHVNTVVSLLGIEFLEVGEDFIRARAPVDTRTKQPVGILHGGVSVLLAETLGSCAAAFASPVGSRVVGLDINANHLRSVKEGWVTGTARPVHVGRSTHVWQIDISNEKGQLTCVSRITISILAPTENAGGA